LRRHGRARTRACGSVVQVSVLIEGAAALKIQYSTPDSMSQLTDTLAVAGHRS
jgi:hypothetical protein